MSSLLTVFVAALAAVVLGEGLAQARAPKSPASATLSKEGYAEARKSADAQYKIDREACSSLAGNVKDVCIAEAKARNDVARADAAVAYENTPATRQNARVARARAAYDVAIEKCDYLASNAKSACVNEAKAELAQAKAEPKSVGDAKLRYGKT